MAQGIIRFIDNGGNVVFNSQLSGSMTLTNGVEPNVLQVEVPPLVYSNRVGTVEFVYDGTVVRRLFGCEIESYDPKFDGQGRITASMTILDRRWTWLDRNGPGQISGEYNLSRSESPIPEFERTPQELAVLCLRELGETDWDVSVLPASDRPYVHWDVENPATALAELCDLFACEPTLGPDNVVRIVKLGQGAPMPSSPNPNHYVPTNQLATLPFDVAALSAGVEWQVDLLLLPYGFEKGEEEPKPIDDLSYAPSGEAGGLGPGKNNQEPDSWIEAVNDDEMDWITDEEERKLAEQHVYRTWKVVLDPQLSLEDNPPNLASPNALFPLNRVEQILPLINELVETEGAKWDEERKPSLVWGSFRKGKPFAGSQEEASAIDRSSYKRELEYDGRFRVDEERGLVFFPEPMLADDSDPEKRKPGTDGNIIPKMYLRCSINLRSGVTREVQRFEVRRTVDPTSPSGTEFKVRNDVFFRLYKSSPSSNFWVSSRDVSEAFLNAFLNEAIQEYERFPGAQAQFPGFIPIANDGAIRSITYGIDASGVAYTNVSRNREVPVEALTFKERRQRHKLRKALRDRDRVAREVARRNRDRDRFWRSGRG